MPVYERLGDVRSKAVTLFKIARIEQKREQLVEAFGHLAESYEIFTKLNIPNGLAAVGELYGQMLLSRGEREKGFAILEIARDAANLLGWTEDAERVQDLIHREQIPT
ncbi:hypothetical protein CCP3SC1_1860001 [Gammaproteobacteria bacterium]